jgi:hypothetical protein
MYIYIVRDMGSKEARKRFSGWNLYDNNPRHPVKRFISDARIRKEQSIRLARKANPRS